MKRIYHFAVVGCGRMGRRRILTIHKHPRAKLVFVVDKNQEKKDELEKEFDCLYSSNYRKVANKQIDCVIVSVPNKWHHEIVEFALRNKKHVWCEKPLARTVEEAKSMVEAAKRYNVTLKTGGNLRYFPNILKARDLLDKQKIGKLYFLRSWVGHGGWTQNGWYSDKNLSGGGTFLDNGSHVFDITRWFLGEVKNCMGVVHHYRKERFDVEDNGFGIFETTGGKTAFIQSSWTEWKGYMYMEIYGSKGYITIDNRGKSCKMILGDINGKETIFDFSDISQNSYEKEFSEYIELLDKGENPKPTGFDGLRAVEMAWGVYKSSKTGKKVIL